MARAQFQYYGQVFKFFQLCQSAPFFYACYLFLLFYYPLNSFVAANSLPSEFSHGNDETYYSQDYWKTRQGVHRLAYAVENDFSMENFTGDDRFKADIKLPGSAGIQFMTLDVAFLQNSNSLVLSGRHIDWSSISSYSFVTPMIILCYLQALSIPDKRISHLSTSVLGGLLALVSYTSVREIFTHYAPIYSQPLDLVSYFKDDEFSYLGKAYAVLYERFSRTKLPAILTSLTFQPRKNIECQKETVTRFNNTSVTLCLPYMSELLVMSLDDFSKWSYVRDWLTDK